jgi:hypothetical protein
MVGKTEAVRRANDKSHAAGDPRVKRLGRKPKPAIEAKSRGIIRDGHVRFRGSLPRPVGPFVVAWPTKILPARPQSVKACCNVSVGRASQLGGNVPPEFFNASEPQYFAAFSSATTRYRAAAC